MSDIWKDWLLPQRIPHRAAGSANWSRVCSCSRSRTCGTYRPEKEKQEVLVIFCFMKRSREKNKRVAHPGDEAVAHVLGKLLVVFQLLQENATGQEEVFNKTKNRIHRKIHTQYISRCSADLLWNS